MSASKSVCTRAAHAVEVEDDPFDVPIRRKPEKLTREEDELELEQPQAMQADPPHSSDAPGCACARGGRSRPRHGGKYFAKLDVKLDAEEETVTTALARRLPTIVPFLAFTGTFIVILLLLASRQAASWPSPPAHPDMQSPLFSSSPPPPLPALPPLPPSQPADEQVVSWLRDVFLHGAPSNTLAETGIIVRQFDGLSDIDGGKPWLPCPPTRWCASYASQWPASIINAKTPLLYYEEEGGFIIDSTLCRIHCAYASDGNSMGKFCSNDSNSSCIPGCYPRGQQCQELGRDWDCSFDPSSLRGALQAQLDRCHGGNRPGVCESHNEVVVDTQSVVEHLPSSIKAFFFLKSPTKAQTARQSFLTAYGLRPSQVPLVHVNLLRRTIRLASGTV